MTEKPLTRVEKIASLIWLKWGRFAKFFRVDEKIKIYKDELDRKSDEEISELLLQAENQYRQDQQSMLHVAPVTRQRIGSRYEPNFFNRPEAKANFDHYAKLAEWKEDEAVALLLGKNPEIVNERTIRRLAKPINGKPVPFAKEYEQLRDIII